MLARDLLLVFDAILCAVPGHLFLAFLFLLCLSSEKEKEKPQGNRLPNFYH